MESQPPAKKARLADVVITFVEADCEFMRVRYAVVPRALLKTPAPATTNLHAQDLHDEYKAMEEWWPGLADAIQDTYPEKKVVICDDDGRKILSVGPLPCAQPEEIQSECTQHVVVLWKEI